MRQLNFKNNGPVLLLKMLGIETVSCLLWQRMARMNMDKNLKKLGQPFQVLMLCLQNLPKELLLLVLTE